MPKAIFLLRGLPGSGKSSLALELSEEGRYPVFAIDDYFINQETGEYMFDHKSNHLAYAACEANVEKSMKEGQIKIFVDNTFTLEWEMNPYFALASNYSYRIFVLTVENRHGGKNVHHISEEQVEKMAIKYKVKLLP